MYGRKLSLALVIVTQRDTSFGLVSEEETGGWEEVCEDHGCW
jgi:hypothetical protein